MSQISRLFLRFFSWLRSDWYAAAWIGIILYAVCLWLDASFLNTGSSQIKAASYAVVISLGLFAASFNPARALSWTWDALGAALLFIWIANVSSVWQMQTVVLWIIGFVAIFAVFFLLEGFELACTVLADKDDDQLPDPIAVPLRQIGAERGLFYDSREVLIILLVACLTIASDLHPIWLPILGESHNRFVGLAFSLIFTSALLVWIAQGPGKQLASDYAVAFLQVFHFPFFWRMLRQVGTLMRRMEATAPSELVISVLRYIPRFSQPEVLPPSRKAFYVNGLRQYGYSVHRAEERVRFTDGVIEFKQTTLFYIVGGGRRSFAVAFKFDSNISSYDYAVSAYRAPEIGERLTSTLETWLDNVFNGNAPGPEYADMSYMLPPRHEFVDERNAHYFKIVVDSLNPLPPANTTAMVIRVRMSLTLSAGAFFYPTGSAITDRVTDKWSKIVSCPHGKYGFVLELARGDRAVISEGKEKVCLFRDELHPEESERIRVELTEKSRVLHTRIDYPLAGAQYDFSWGIWLV